MATNPKYEPLVEKNPINQALDFQFIVEVIANIIAKHFPSVGRIDKISHETHKRRVGKKHSTFIYSIFVSGKTKNGKSFKKHLIYSAHSDGSRERAFNNMKTLIELGFNNGPNRIIEPLEYKKDLQALIYEAVEGKNLFQFMSQGSDRKIIELILNRAALWIQEFHHIKLPVSSKNKFPVFNYYDLNVDSKKLHELVKSEDSHQGEKLEAFMRAMDDMQKRMERSYAPGIVYGDFHPENIITDDPDKSGLVMIDLVDVSMGDQLRDIGSFIQQLHFMGRIYFDERTVNNLRIKFLETYFQQPFNTLNPIVLQRINTYQAWNAMRGFVWFFLQRPTRSKSYGMLEDAWLYLTLALESENKITIYD